MKLNLDDRFSPAHVLDIFPENTSEEQILRDFMGNAGSEEDLSKITIEIVHGGISIRME